ncbi:non-specific serine/threonine protein kinase [Saitozyma sp. JCM 24511]|nr:non-specific serine/threonine protein kinase [Saitozyma sp. JCM 24511]
MFSRVLKSATQQSSPAPSSQPPTTPSKSRTQHTKAQSTTNAHPSPSKIPVPSAPVSRSAFVTGGGGGGAKENQPAPPPSPSHHSERASYLSFLWNQSQSGAPTTPVKVNPKVTQPTVPHHQHQHHQHQHHGQAAASAPGPNHHVYDPRQSAYPHQAHYESEDVHMQTMKNTVNPAMLKSLAAIPAPAPVAAPAQHKHPHAQVQQLVPQRSQAAHAHIYGGSEDVYMKTAKHDVRTEKEKGLQLWERELLDSQEVKRKATVAQIFFLDYYFDLLGYIAARKKRLENFKNDTAERGVSGPDYSRELQSYNGRERVILRKRRTKLRVEQFRIIAQVGQGGYGSVYLARKADTNEVCALKKMRKGTLAKMDEVKHVLVERDILTNVKTPWLVKLLYAFQDKEHVYLAMEYVPGGDFRTLLNNSGVLKEEHARFYAAEMFASLNELHKLGYIHRDLKPELDQVKDENLVFRSTLERRTLYRSMRMAEPRYADSVVGSPDYMPPEVLRGKTYTYSADYWSLGCILFEFLCGFPPFSGSTPEETWANLKNWTKVLRRPVYDRPEDLIFNLTDTAWDAVTRLIAHPKDRVATLQDVQALPFFSPLPFGTLRQREAPFVPVLDGETDVGYFDSFESPEDMAKYAEVFKKQRDVEAVEEKGQGKRDNWVGFTFGRNAVQQVQPQPRIKAEGEALQTMF